MLSKAFDTLYPILRPEVLLLEKALAKRAGDYGALRASGEKVGWALLLVFTIYW